MEILIVCLIGIGIIAECLILMRFVIKISKSLWNKESE